MPPFPTLSERERKRRWWTQKGRARRLPSGNRKSSRPPDDQAFGSQKHRQSGALQFFDHIANDTKIMIAILGRGFMQMNNLRGMGGGYGTHNHKLPRIHLQMALPCENDKIPSIGIMESPERNSLVDEAQYDDAVLSNSTGAEAKNSGERSQIVAADSHSSQTNKNLLDSHTSKGGLDAMLSPQRDSTQADLQLYDGNNLQESTLRHSCKSCDVLTVRVFSDTISLKKDFPETGHSGEKSHIAAASLGTCFSIWQQER
ncbi:uncharacterized protein LOC116266803 [Nymphaea colorata]|nr:uncharacterized protein LOC116266803 [Nymphaea colorata]